MLNGVSFYFHGFASLPRSASRGTPPMRMRYAPIRLWWPQGFRFVIHLPNPFVVSSRHHTSLSTLESLKNQEERWRRLKSGLDRSGSKGCRQT